MLSLSNTPLALGYHSIVIEPVKQSVQMQVSVAKDKSINNYLYTVWPLSVVSLLHQTVAAVVSVTPPQGCPVDPVCFFLACGVSVEQPKHNWNVKQNMSTYSISGQLSAALLPPRGDQVSESAPEAEITFPKICQQRKQLPYLYLCLPYFRLRLSSGGIAEMLSVVRHHIYWLVPYKHLHNFAYSMLAGGQYLSTIRKVRDMSYYGGAGFQAYISVRKRVTLLHTLGRSLLCFLWHGRHGYLQRDSTLSKGFAN